MRLLAFTAAFGFLLVSACTAEPAAPLPSGTFAEVRAQHQTSIGFESGFGGEAMPTPPEGVFLKVTYPAAPGALGAYLTPDPGDGQRHPAIIWLTGGESNTVTDVWSPAGRDNDQNATAYREAGIVMMFPTLRGGNDNPGQVEGMYGEVDDILAAAQYLAQQPYVDPSRIYLGGHSTGGTLVLLVAEASDMFRGVFSFGPVADARVYGADFIPADFYRLPAFEHQLRAPGMWLSSIRNRTIVIEGAVEGNRDQLELMQRESTNPQISFVLVPNASHFSVLAPGNEVIARAILADTGEAPVLNVTEADITAAMAQ